MAFQACGLITLTTDFGVSDPYVGVMKGVILARHPAARLVDLTHQIPAFQPALAGFWLARIWPYFPTGTVHLAVVDPGVGTDRRMVMLQMESQVFIAPDNGLLQPVLHSSPHAQWQVFDLDDLRHLQLPRPSHTFHGRDIFAPLVAEISAGRQQPDTLGTAMPSGLIAAAFPAGEGHIVCADHYGNLLTDIDSNLLKKFENPALLFRHHQIPLKRSYGFAAAGELLTLANSWGTLEIAVAQGNAQTYLQAIPGESVRLADLG